VQRSVALPLTTPARSLLDERPLAPGETITLAPWDVLIAEEAEDATA
jgi:hypothetical protein